ncbi:MAG: hypothetical protein KAI86_04165 [Desulfobacterales bacterium]|nr:hypothetical protein [Desulfobacterales bacterium]
MMIDVAGIWVIEAFEFRICFAFRASDFEFSGQAGKQEKKTTMVPACLDK